MIRFPAGYDSLNRIKRYQDYYQASYGVMLLSAGQFSPLSLFAAGEQGAWYDPSDLDRYMSGLGTEGSPALSEYVTVLTGTWAASGANYIFTDTVGGQSRPGVQYPTTSLVAGWYRVVVVVAAINGATQIRMDGVGAADQLLTVGTNTYTLNVTSTSRPRFRLEDLSTTIGDSFTITSISIKEVTSVSSATMFQDAAGTTPVTAVEQPVGLLLDKSKGLALGAELVTNGDFSSNTWWSTGGGAAISGGALNFTAAVATSGAYRLGFATVGKYYELTFEIISISSGGIQITLGTSSGTNRTAAGVYTQRILCTGNTNLTLYSVGASTTASVDNVSIKEVQGNHASQSTAASRPVLSARVNQLTYTEDFSNAAWSKGNLVTAGMADVATAPDGTNTADAVTATTANAPHVINQPNLTVQNATYTVSVYAKANGYNFIALQFTNDASFTKYYEGIFNLSNGTVEGTSRAVTYTGSRATPVDVGNGWYRLSITINSVDANSTSRVQAIVLSTNDPTTTYAGNNTSGIYLWGADLRITNVGVNLPAYQRVAAATDYDTSNFPLYLKFDGVDDSLATGTIDFSATDKMSVFAGVRKLSDAAGGEIVSLGNITSVNGSFELRGPRAAAPNYMFGSRGTSFADANIASGYSAPITNVVTGIADISVDLCALRINGTVVASPTTDQGTGNYSSGVVFVGRLGGTALSFNGNLYSIIVRGALSTDAQIASTETYVNNLTKAY